MNGFRDTKNNFRKTFTSTFTSGFGKKGARSRSGSRDSKKSFESQVNDAMRESTISFFKEAYGIKDRPVSRVTNEQIGSSPGLYEDSFNTEGRTSVSTLKNRRMTNPNPNYMTGNMGNESGKVRLAVKGNLNKENPQRLDSNYEEIIHSATIKPSSKISMISRH
jgi:hypothetical protein